MVKVRARAVKGVKVGLWVQVYGFELSILPRYLYLKLPWSQFYSVEILV